LLGLLRNGHQASPPQGKKQQGRQSLAQQKGTAHAVAGKEIRRNS